MTYPTPATPLPWVENDWTQDRTYMVRAANAFPHLVAALDDIIKDAQGGCEGDIIAIAERALAIARGEVTS